MHPSTSQKFLPACLPTGIGSLPFREVREAVDLIDEFYHEIPFWPQLPLKNKKENMLAQFLHGVPFLEAQESAPGFTLTGDNPKLLTALAAWLSENGRASYMMTSEEASAWDSVLNFFKHEGHPAGAYFKTQITGPITLALNVRDSRGKNLFEFPKLVDWLKNFLLEKARWQVEAIRKKEWIPIVILDEPSLSSLEPLIIRSQKKFLTEILRTFASELGKEGAIVGLHCCGRTDWSLVFETGMEIVSFDAVKDIGHFLERKDLVRSHFEKGHVVAWGVVPSEYLGYDLDIRKLAESFLGKLKALVLPPVSLNHVLIHSLITTSCGTAGLSREDNFKAHRWVRDVSNLLRKEVLNIE